MKENSLLNHARSFVLPLGVVIVIPFLLSVGVRPFAFRIALKFPGFQIPASILLFALGLFLLIVTVRLFARVGKGTLAPWDPTRRLVTQGVYSHLRNPMISGVALMNLAESILLGSWPVFCWFLFVVAVNTVYFKLSEEPGLVKRFGPEYKEYRANVPMWIPRMRPWRPP